ncbi:hypothetical protein niasHT_012450 [Heterodera trifolii]|uniref:RING-type domain-containing protein n=1 Tax=Heterodera trifolii TaxID=157864 RepID=A0ABD2L432_9BILA
MWHHGFEPPPSVLYYLTKSTSPHMQFFFGIGAQSWDALSPVTTHTYSKIAVMTNSAQNARARLRESKRRRAANGRAARSRYAQVGVKCVICRQNTSTVTRASLSCLHAFHRQCLYKWLSYKVTCPTCFRALTKEDETAIAGGVNSAGTHFTGQHHIQYNAFHFGIFLFSLNAMFTKSRALFSSPFCSISSTFSCIIRLHLSHLPHLSPFFVSNGSPNFAPFFRSLLLLALCLSVRLDPLLETFALILCAPTPCFFRFLKQFGEPKSNAFQFR